MSDIDRLLAFLPEKQTRNSAEREQNEQHRKDRKRLLDAWYEARSPVPDRQGEEAIVRGRALRLRELARELNRQGFMPWLVSEREKSVKAWTGFDPTRCSTIGDHTHEIETLMHRAVMLTLLAQAARGEINVEGV